MSPFRRPAIVGEGGALPREQQHSLLDRVEALARGPRDVDPAGPAARLFGVVLALLALGLVLQASHAATTQPLEEFQATLRGQVLFRIAALFALLAAYRIGLVRLRRHLPALCCVALLCLVLVFVPPFADPKNGAHRWMALPGLGLSFQPSEVARLVMILWVADRCLRLGRGVLDMRRGVLPMLAVGFAFFFLILVETDLGGALLFLLCFGGTMWVGGADLAKVAGPVATVVGATLLALVAGVSYIRQRVLLWIGEATNHQVERTADAMASGDGLGVGLGLGQFRNARVPYLESDYVFALVGEELGLFGMGCVVALLITFAWQSLRFVLSVRDRYAALCAFGLLLSVVVQAMVHVQVVTRLAPPKGMPLPFLSHGGTALVVSSFAVGLALSAARPSPSSSKLAAPSVPADPTPSPIPV